MARKPKIGRPTDYKPEYCDRVVEMGKKGLSMVQMAAKLGQARNTLDAWGKKHGPFMDALTRARTEAQNWWETEGMNSLNKDKFQSSVWRTSMQARFREDYTERRDHTVGGAITVVVSEDDKAL